jgi:acyl-CoA reductase-like NAD-dependent aldehyde dehydrogenase
MVNDTAASRVSELVTDGVEKGARLLAGGDVADAYHEPTVLADVPSMPRSSGRKRPGPCSPSPPADVDTTLALANGSRCGLDSGIGREGVGYSIDECTVLKTVVVPG